MIQITEAELLQEDMKHDCIECTAS